MLIINMGEIEMFRLHHAITIHIKGTWSKIVFKRHHMRAIMKRHMNQQPLPYQQHQFIDHDTVVLEVAAVVVVVVVVESVVTAIKCATHNNASQMATIIVVNSSQ